MKKSIIYSISDNEFRNLVERSDTYTDVLKYFHLSNKGSNSDVVKKRIHELDINISHFVTYRVTVPFSRVYSNSEVYCKDSRYSSSSLRNRILSDHVVDYICSKCGLGNEWQGDTLSLQLDHINGDHFDNRIENLRFLCPNCHSQTKTFSSKGRKIIRSCSECGSPITKASKSGLCVRCFSKSRERSSPVKKEKLIELIEKGLTNVAIAKIIGCSDSTVGKWKKRWRV